MNKETARFLLESLIERIDGNAIGAVTTAERQALRIALAALSEAPEPAPPTVVAPEPSPQVILTPPQPVPPPAEVVAPPAPAPTTADIRLVTAALDRTEADNPGLLLCLDFGTAMSKAFARTDEDVSLELELGAEGGGDGYAVPSSLFITDTGQVLFGLAAIDASQELISSGRQRLDSIKSLLTLRSQGNLDACPLSNEMDPVGTTLTEGDLVRIYLAYLTDLAVSQLEAQSTDADPISRYVRRRFAHPCWPSAAQKTWADRLMRTWMAEAQILADTFHGKWADGIAAADIKEAIRQVRALDRRPDFLIADGVPEPIAVAAGALADGTDKRLPFVVVDVGAGTTDFGLFVLREDEATELSRVFQVPGSIKGLMQAGDKIDGLLKKFILDLEHVDLSDPQGRLVAADLTRRIRGLKERLFTAGEVTYVLADSTLGTVTLENFLASAPIQEFRKRIDSGFREVLEAVDDSWLNYFEKTGLSVVLTGGGAGLPMMQQLAEDWIEIRGKRIRRTKVDAIPSWIIDDVPDLEPVYPQLAVAIGGAAADLPETIDGPQYFAGGGNRHAYVAGSLQLSGT